MIIHLKRLESLSKNMLKKKIYLKIKLILLSMMLIKKHYKISTKGFISIAKMEKLLH